MPGRGVPMPSINFGLEAIQINRLIFFELPSVGFRAKVLQKCPMDEAVEFAAVAAENEVAFPELADHGPGGHCRLGRVPMKTFLQVIFELPLELFTSKIIAAVVRSGLHEQSDSAKQLFLVVFSNEPDLEAFVLQMTVDVPAFDQHRGCVVVDLPAFPWQFLMSAYDGQDRQQKRISGHLFN